MYETMPQQPRDKQLVAFRAWADEYEQFKKICHEWRTTPTAKFNEFIRETVQDYNKKEDK